MLPPSFFSSSAFSIASITGVIVNFAYYGLIFAFSLFFQLEQHLSPQETGIAFLPMTIILMIMNFIYRPVNHTPWRASAHGVRASFAIFSERSMSRLLLSAAIRAS